MSDPTVVSPAPTNAQDETRSVVKAAGLIGVATFSSRILGFIRDAPADQAEDQLAAEIEAEAAVAGPADEGVDLAAAFEADDHALADPRLRDLELHVRVVPRARPAGGAAGGAAELEQAGQAWDAALEKQTAGAPAAADGSGATPATPDGSQSSSSSPVTPPIAGSANGATRHLSASGSHVTLASEKATISPPAPPSCPSPSSRRCRPCPSSRSRTSS